MKNSKKRGKSWTTMKVSKIITNFKVNMRWEMPLKKEDEDDEHDEDRDEEKRRNDNRTIHFSAH